MYMAMGLMDNGGGMVDTFEFIPENYNKAMANFNKSDLRKFISAACMDVGTFIPSTQYDMIFLDTEPQTRFQELIRFFDYLKPGGFVFIHDLHQHMGQMENAEHGFAWPWGEMLPTITEWVQHNKLRPFHFKTPRGLTGFYKVDENDYKWGGK
jgi:predicted O-methyltransferase YrrM